jgi:hypothetical protein
MKHKLFQVHASLISVEVVNGRGFHAGWVLRKNLHWANRTKKIKMYLLPEQVMYLQCTGFLMNFSNCDYLLYNKYSTVFQLPSLLV